MSHVFIHRKRQSCAPWENAANDCCNGRVTHILINRRLTCRPDERRSPRTRKPKPQYGDGPPCFPLCKPKCALIHTFPKHGLPHSPVLSYLPRKAAGDSEGSQYRRRASPNAPRTIKPSLGQIAPRIQGAVLFTDLSPAPNPRPSVSPAQPVRMSIDPTIILLALVETRHHPYGRGNMTSCETLWKTRWPASTPAFWWPPTHHFSS